jgi:hypothetical protein
LPPVTADPSAPRDPDAPEPAAADPELPAEPTSGRSEAVSKSVPDAAPERRARIKERLSNAAEITAAVAVALGFGASFGFNYGVNNQVVYLLGSLGVLDPELFKNDWFASQTTHYHPAFKYLGALLIAIDRRGWGIGIGLAVCIALGMLGVYALLRALLGRRTALPAFFVLTAFAFTTGTRGPAVTYVFDGILQPSTLGSACFLASIPLFVRERWLASGILLALSGLFHANYLLLLSPAFAFAHLAIGRRDLARRLIRQLGPPALILLLFLPIILGTARSPDAARAQQIYFEVRSPHHFLVSNQLRDFMPFLAWHLIALGAAIPLLRGQRGRSLERLTLLLTGLLIVIWSGLVASVAFGVRQATQLFAWRVLPHAELLLVVLFVVALSRSLVEPGLIKRHTIASLALVMAGTGCLLLVNAAHTKEREQSQLLLAALGAFAVVQVGRVLVRRFVHGGSRERIASNLTRAAPTALLLGSALILYLAARDPMATIQQRSTLVQGLNRHERDLFEWMRKNTPKDAVFLSPPQIETIRYHGRRAIVVDWKSNPIVPAEVLEWYRRLEDVSGRRNLRGMGDLQGYQALDERRLSELRQRYRFDYVIVQRGRDAALAGKRTVFANGGFAVLDLRE